MFVAVNRPGTLSRFESAATSWLGLMEAASMNCGDWAQTPIAEARAIVPDINKRMNLESLWSTPILVILPDTPKVTANFTYNACEPADVILLKFR